MGPVTPLIALYQRLKAKTDTEALWVGTRRGPEVSFVASYGLRYKSITSAKLRRSFDIRNFFIPIFLLIGFFESLIIVLSFKPNIIVSAGGFNSVPLAWAGFFLRVPVLIHQEDVKIGLANLLMAPISKMVTTAFPEVAKVFPHPNRRGIGNPIREEILNSKKKNKNECKVRFGLSNQLPVLLVLGGGTGALAINRLVWEGRQDLQKTFQILHVTGRDKGHFPGETGYVAVEFLGNEDLPCAYAAADLVLSRAGLGVIGELAALGLPTAFMPIPSSHQEINALYLEERGAAVVLPQTITGQKLASELNKLFLNIQKMEKLSQNIKAIFPPDAAERLAELVIKLSKKNRP